MSESCPFCTIPTREHLLYNDSLVYLVRTKDMKGHKHRVTVATHRHASEPNFHELTRAYAVLYHYMSKLGLREWCIVDRTYARWPDHWHLVACDAYTDDPEEHDLLEKTPKVTFPLDDFTYFHGYVMIGIPTHNEAAHIEEVVRKARPYGEVVVFDDSSTDGTSDIALRAGARVLRAPAGRGYGFALKNLFAHAREYGYDALVTLDGDGQHDPGEIPRLLTALHDADVVLGNRFLGDSVTPLHRETVIRTLNKFYGVGDSQCGFRAYSRRALEKIEITDNGMGASLDILGQVKSHGLRVAEVPVTITYEDTEHSEGALKHGMNLLESLFWGTVWRRPYTFLGIPSLLLFLFSVFCGGMLLHLYHVSKYFVVSYGVLMVGSFVASMCLAIATFFITVQRRLLKEVR
ncbi:MAG: glycosyltransferase family 2 protein [Deltaproteobacteria bacterium]|nr:glycosyltransferase family 2 protein [Deltaproteobacteria bacterium]